MWDVGAAFLGGTLKYARFSKKTEQNLLCLPPAESLLGRTLAVPFMFVADDAFTLLVNIMKTYATHNPGSSFLETIFKHRLSRQYRIVENVFDTSGVPRGGFGVFKPPPKILKALQKIVPNSTRL